MAEPKVKKPAVKKAANKIIIDGDVTVTVKPGTSRDKVNDALVRIQNRVLSGA